MHPLLLRTTPLLATLVLAAACASSRPQASAAALSGYVCDQGNPVLVVRNTSGREVEIVESRTGSGGRAVIAVVGSGRHEVRIRNETAYSYVAQEVGGGTVFSATSRPRVRERAVILEKECRES
jgi:hypothetical protein